ncbi:N-alpha-acetyltransferase 25, NatB auxiliary subunit [Fopius arisanus]|uniref:N-terminal acetyltransferase B complex subunit MDM20 homolog n=1 Tax=Fopius arisanus TaxID=64838 RepID=A0A0C9QUM7_9HYME|nr:PREDICTED: N-alpha-acetyltransferase 25, NatB auxiliary subunit [Fopius arisanus]
MASKAHVDSTVNERRLRPIYDWLDNGNNKKALQEADKVLRKQPTNQCARVLKALALLRLGKEDECQNIMEQVRFEVPCEDSTLQAMSICYKEIHQPEKIREVYEAAAKADPHNEELLTHLFMAYVRLGDFRKQQQTALALYKLKLKNPYYFWAVMSVVMQAIEADDKLAKDVILPLAERMVLKLVNEDKLEAEQEVQLYLMILELQGKDESVLEVLNGPLSDKLSGVPQRKASLLLKLDKHEEATNAFKKFITEDSDNWSHYLNYLTSALEHQKPTECLEFLDKIAETSGKKVRGPQLGRFELLKRCNSVEIHLRDVLEPVKLMRKYFEQFGNKGCIVGDLRLYLDLFTDNERIQLFQEISGDVGVTDDTPPTSTDQMLRHIHLEELKRICGMHHSPNLDVQGRTRLVERLCKFYDIGNKLCPSDERLPTDFAPFDSYILIASHVLLQLFYETSDARYLYQGMMHLENALATSPANFHLKIMLVRSYLEAGLIGAADHAYALLDVKQIQLDSLGYLHVPLLAPMGHLSGAASALDQAVKFFIGNYKHSADRLTFAYKYGSFVKIQEFVELRERLEKSLHFATSTVDKMLLDISWCESCKSLSGTLATMRIQPHEDPIRWDLLRDNRDLEVVVSWEPITKSKDPRRYDDTRECMMTILAARNLILRIIAATAEPDSSSLLSKLSGELRTLESERLAKCLELFQQERGVRVDNQVIPMDAVERLREARDSGQLKIIARVAEAFAKLSKPDDETIEALRGAVCLEAIDVGEGIVSYKEFMLRAATCGETLAFIGAMCVEFSNQSHPRIANRRNRKKSHSKEISINNDDVQSWTKIGHLLTEKAQRLESVLTNMEKRSPETGLEITLSQSANVVLEHTQESIQDSCRMLKSRLSLTVKLINGLRS